VTLVYRLQRSSPSFASENHQASRSPACFKDCRRGTLGISHMQCNLLCTLSHGSNFSCIDTVVLTFNLQSNVIVKL
jgi:hypothetical protein